MKDKVLQILKTWNGTDIDADIIDLAIDEAEQAIRNYCGRWQVVDDAGTLEDLPDGLLFTWARMANDIYAAYLLVSGGLGGDSTSGSVDIVTGATGPLKAVTTGDTRLDFNVMSYKEKQDAILTAANIATKYAESLMPYRRLYPDIKEGVPYDYFI